MTENELDLPSAVSHVTVDGKDVYLVGTAHVSKESVDDVRTTIELVGPDCVAVELCPARHAAMTQQDAWKKMDIFKVIRQGKAVFLLVQLIMSSFYRKLGEQLGVQPGAEMMEGVKLARERDLELVLADRDVQVTLKRVWGYLSLWNKMKLLVELLGSIFVSENVDEKMVEEIKNQDQLENIMGAFAESFPGVKERLIDERDIYLAQKIRFARGNRIVAVVGAGHVPGIMQEIRQETDLAPLVQIPPRGRTGLILKWGIPLAIVALFVIGFFRGGASSSIDALWIWFLVNGLLSGAGAAVALAHPLTIAATFLGAPLTSLNPMIAAGWVAGLVQAWVKRPTVADLEDLPNAVCSVKGFWMNPVSRILLVVVLANVGSSLGTFISGSWIAVRVF